MKPTLLLIHQLLVYPLIAVGLIALVLFAIDLARKRDAGRPARTFGWLLFHLFSTEIFLGLLLFRPHDDRLMQHLIVMISAGALINRALARWSGFSEGGLTARLFPSPRKAVICISLGLLLVGVGTYVIAHPLDGLALAP